MAETMTKERPILFSAPMVRAILAGDKSQTRRVVKPQPSRNIVRTGLSGKPMSCFWEPGMTIVHCPHGKPGDRLWVRETFAPRTNVDPVTEPEKAREYALYQADGTSLDEPHWHPYPGRWQPSIFMPRWACRIVLEITEVRVERVQDITHRDCVAEGWPGSPEDRAYIEAMGDGNDACIDWYANLWESINGKGSWDANPWVWVVGFKRLEVARG